MDATPVCPVCRKPVVPNAPHGLCPECLMKGGVETRGAEDVQPRKSLPAPPGVGEVVKRFPELEIMGLLGQGGMGAVYKARQPHLDRFVALKILLTEKLDDPLFAERFRREARALATLNHPRIVTIYDFGEAQGNYFLLMEFLDGLTLRQLLQTRSLSADEALAVVSQICQAVQYAHEQGIVHRDIKPENILLDSRGQAKIADFGIAKLLDPEAQKISLTSEQQVVGTLHYMAPEQLEKPQTVDHRADIYSLGVVFYEMLTGELPLGKFQPPSQIARVDARLDEVVLRALEKKPERRYQKVSEIETDVEIIAATPGNRPDRILPPRRLSPGSSAGRKRITVIGSLGLATLIPLLALTLRAGGRKHVPEGLPREGLVALWSGENDAGDSVGTHEGQLINVSFVRGAMGNAFHLNGSNAFVQIPDSVSLKPTNITVAAWVQFDAQKSPRSQSPGQQIIVFKLNTRDPHDGDFTGYNLFKDDDRFAFAIGAPDGRQVIANSVTVPQTGTWYHVAGTYDVRTGCVEVYVNGVREGSAYAGFPLDCGSRPLFIGSTGEWWDSKLQGTVDEVCIYNRSLPGGEIKAGYDAFRNDRHFHADTSTSPPATARPAGSNDAGAVAATAKPLALPRDGLVSLWSGERGGEDSAGNNRAMLTNVTFAGNNDGRTFVFNGSNATFRVPASPTLNVGSNDGFTLVLWINPTSLDLQSLCEWNQNTGIHHGDAPIGVHLDINSLRGDGLIVGDVADTANISHSILSPADAIVPNTFQHLAMTYGKADGIAKLYRNGIVVATMNLGSFTPQTGYDFFVGSRPAGNFTGIFFQGQMDEIAIYRRALTAAEIKVCYDAGRNTKFPSGDRR